MFLKDIDIRADVITLIITSQHTIMSYLLLDQATKQKKVYSDE